MNNAPSTSLPPFGSNRPGAGVPQPQVQTIACQVCGTVRLAMPAEPTTLVGVPVRIKPCAVCQLLKVMQALSAQDIEMREHICELEAWAENSDLIVQAFGAAAWSDEDEATSEETSQVADDASQPAEETAMAAS